MLAHKLLVIGFLGTGVFGLQDKLGGLVESRYSYSPSLIQEVTGYSPQILQHKIRMLGVDMRQSLGQFGHDLSGEMHQVSNALARTPLLNNLRSELNRLTVGKS